CDRHSLPVGARRLPDPVPRRPDRRTKRRAVRARPLCDSRFLWSEFHGAAAYRNRDHRPSETIHGSTTAASQLIAGFTKSLSEKGSDSLRRGQKLHENDSPPKGQPPFRI